ncbi:hypothetical protein GCM10011392_12140 [Wenxinia marina]|uniref:hypothetical protein n=1 Tax=Wenxinia marina TaxID=390641 RepID=UPI000381BC5A|nr:hypothetical protein [Wenxinia marina]GGL59226.1 hypothetical protein GCM10011392_12140 [Wenxinia marina]
MSRLRLTLLAFLCLALLPWGAFARAFPAPPQPAAAEAVTDGAVTAILTFERHCKGPALPGSPCGHDHGQLPTAAPAMPVPPGGLLPRTYADLRLAGRAPPGSLDPPRAG